MPGGIRYGNLYVASEGINDEVFLDKLLSNRGITGFTIGHAKGKDDWQAHFGGVAGSSDRGQLRGLIVVGDNNDNPSQRFRAICDALTHEGFPAPPAPNAIVDGPPVVSVVMLPEGTHQGCLETVLVDAVLDAHPELKVCLNNLQDCVPKTKAWNESTQSKMRLHTAIAVCCHEDPSAALQYVWKKSGNPIPIENARFNPLADFFRSFRDRVLGS